MYNTITPFTDVAVANVTSFGDPAVDLTATPATGALPAFGSAPLAANTKSACVHLIATGTASSTRIIVRVLGRKRDVLTWHDAGRLPTFTLNETKVEHRFLVPCDDFDALFLQFTTFSDTPGDAMVTAYVNQSEELYIPRGLTLEQQVEIGMWIPHDTQNLTGGSGLADYTTANIRSPLGHILYRASGSMSTGLQNVVTFPSGSFPSIYPAQAGKFDLLYVGTSTENPTTRFQASTGGCNFSYQIYEYVGGPDLG